MIMMALCILVSAGACKPRQAINENDNDIKASVGDRNILGAGSPYEVRQNLERHSDHMKKRRQLGWETFAKIIRPVDVTFTGEDNARNFSVPLFQTWYSATEFERIFGRAFFFADNEELEFLREDLGTMIVPFPTEVVDEAFASYVAAVRSGQEPGWDHRRLQEHFQKFSSEEEDRRLGVHEKTGARARGNTVMSPALLRHYLETYHLLHKNCIASFPSAKAQLAVKEDGSGYLPAGDDTFADCFGKTVPRDAVVLKLTWERAGQTSNEEGAKPETISVFDTSAAGIKKVLGTSRSPITASGGSGQFDPVAEANPGPEDIYTITFNDTFGVVSYRMTGMHIITKELDHWLWVSLWWAPDADDNDFGEDMPESIGGVWRNYKMCVVTDYKEQDPNPGSHYSRSHPTLAKALNAAHAASQPYSWCANPFIELGKGNARTNCIGCHQHAGVRWTGGNSQRFFNADTFDERCDDGPIRRKNCAHRRRFPYFGRTQQRRHFLGDYMYSFDMPDARMLHIIRRATEEE